MERIVIVGASLAGLSAAETLREAGYDGDLVVVGAEQKMPYDRPPLSKEILRGDSQPDESELRPADAYEKLDIDWRLGRRAAALDPAARTVMLDGGEIDADVVVLGIGVVPATDWLESSGLPLDDGVVCDATCATPAPGVVAAGDVARWPNPLFGEVMRVEHWTNATEQGRAAALTLLEGSGAKPFAPVPYFWSDQYDLKIQFVGRAGRDDEFVVAEGSFAEGAGVGLFGRAGRLVGALTFNRPKLSVWVCSQCGSRQAQPTGEDHTHHPWSDAAAAGTSGCGCG